MIYVMVCIVALYAGFIALICARAYNRERPGRPDQRKIRALEVELGLEPPPPNSLHEVIKDAWAGSPGSWREDLVTRDAREL